MSKVIAEYDARTLVLANREDTQVLNGTLALCDDGKVLGFVKRDTGSDERMVVLGMHYQIENGATLSLVRFDPSATFEGYITRVHRSIIHGEYLPSTSGSVEFGGLHLWEQRSIPKSIFDAVYGRGYIPNSIKKFREIQVADLERLLRNKKRIYDGAGNNNLEAVAIGNGQTTKVLISPKA